MISLQPLFPLWILIVLSLALLLWSLRELWRLPRPFGPRLLLASLRSLAIMLCAVALARPVWLRESPDERKPLLGLLLDASASMQIQDASAGTAPAQRARQALSENAPALRALPFALCARSFAKSASPLELAEDPQWQVPVAAREQGTDLAAALQSLLAEQDGRMGHALLFTDGLHTAGADLLAVAQTCRRRGLKLHCLDLSPPGGLRTDLALVQLQAPLRLQQGRDLRCTAVLRLEHAQPVRVRLSASLDGGKPFPLGEHLLTPGALQSLPLTIPMTGVADGWHEIALHADADIAERQVRDNRRAIAVELVSGGPVLHLWATRPSPDLKFLQRQLAVMEGFKLESPPPEQFSQTLEKLLRKPPQGPEAFILCDADLAAVDPELLRRWSERVRQSGGGMLFILGPQLVASLPKLGAVPWLPSPAATPFARRPWLLEEEAGAHPLTQGLDWSAAAAVTSEAPALQLMGVAPPQAMVLLRNSGTPWLLADMAEPRHLALCTTDLWRLSLAGATRQTLYQPFLSRLAAWLLRQEQSGGLSVSILPRDPDRRRSLQVQVRSALQEPAPELSAGLASSPAGAPLRLQAAGPGQWSAKLAESAPGHWSFSARQKEATGSTHCVINDLLAEDRSGCDRELLQSLASLSGGTFSPVAELPLLLRSLAAQARPVRPAMAVQGLPLGTHPLLFGGILLLLLGEWLLRRRLMLP